MAEPGIIFCKGITKTYGKDKKPALVDLNLSVKQNTIFGFLGPNGAGKTTAIRILTGLMSPTAGEAVIAGHRVEKHSMGLRASIGYLSQQPRFYNWMSAAELLDFTGTLFHIDAKARAVRTAELLELSGLKDTGKKRISSYSGGMVQRLGIAQALYAKPRVLFLDEPVSALDPLGRKEVLEFIHQLKNETTVFMSTHILEDVQRVCDSVGIINKGSLIVVEEMENLKEKYMRLILEAVFELEKDTLVFESFIKKNYPQYNPRITGTSVLLECDDFSLMRSEVLNLILRENLSLLEFKKKSPSLEDVFVKIIGEDNASN